MCYKHLMKRKKKKKTLVKYYKTINIDYIITHKYLFTPYRLNFVPFG